MKTEKLNSGSSYPPKVNDRQEQQTVREKQIDQKDQSYVVQKMDDGKRQADKKIQKIDQLESVRKEIGESIQWKKMKFHRHEDSGRIYIDIIDRDSGEIIKTIPETEFVKLVNHEKHNPSITINNSG